MNRTVRMTKRKWRLLFEGARDFFEFDYSDSGDGLEVAGYGRMILTRTQVMALRKFLETIEKEEEEAKTTDTPGTEPT